MNSLPRCRNGSLGPLDDIVKALSELEHDYLNALSNTVERARCLMEYLMVGLYVYFPPVRAGPIRELSLGESLLKVNGKWHLDLRKYKTSYQSFELLVK